MPSISVIVPAYNCQSYLQRCIDSILSQTYSDFELILIDDGSTDRTNLICDEYAERDGRIKVIHQTNSGLSAARNAGIEKALTSNSRNLMFVDSDDWLHPMLIESLFNCIKQTGLNIGVCWSKRVAAYDHQPEYTSFPYKIITPEDFFVTSPADATVAWGKIYNKDLFATARYPLGRIHEDLFLTHILLFGEEYIVLDDLPLYYYFVNPDGLSRSPTLKKMKDEIEGFRQRQEFFKEKGFIRAYEYEYNQPSRIALEIQALENGIVSEIQKKSALRKHLRKSLREQSFSLKDYEWLYEIAYPIFMKLYWLKEAGIFKIHKLKKHYGDNK